MYEKIALCRKDFLHKRSREIVKFYDCVVIEDLNMKGMSQALNFGKSTMDNGWGTFVSLLKYKMAEAGKTLIVADKWFPSSKLCSNCGNKKETLTLSERVYSCTHCGLSIDRDANASINLKKYGLQALRA